MRYQSSRRRKRATRGRGYAKAFLLLAAAGLLVYLVTATAAGSWIAEHVTGPLFGGKPTVTGGVLDSPIPTDSEEATPAPAGAYETETVSVGGATLYCIQLGAFSDKANAETQAEDDSLKGGAGYIAYDGKHRLLTAGYGGEAEAKAAVDRLKAEDGVDSVVYPMQVGQLNLKITAAEADVETLRSAFSGYDGAAAKLREISAALASGSLDGDGARSAIQEQQTALAAQRDAITALCEKNPGLPAFVGLQTMLTTAEKNLGELTADTSLSNVAFSSKIKYTYIDMTSLYKTYVTDLTQQSAKKAN